MNRGIAIAAMLVVGWPAVCASEPLRLGHVNFPGSCAASVQRAFSEGVAFLHNFQYAEATKTFCEIAKRDPHCGMAYWGLAMSLYQQLWKWPTASDLQKGRERGKPGTVHANTCDPDGRHNSRILKFQMQGEHS